MAINEVPTPAQLLECTVCMLQRSEHPPSKDARFSHFNTQPRAEGFKAGVFQQFHGYRKGTQWQLNRDKVTFPPGPPIMGNTDVIKWLYAA